jgi:uncharacterized membrane protein YvlD (DUF360 family)
MAHEKGSRSGEGLSPQTLVIAAVASAVAAVVVSHFWKGGTVVAAAMTPVIVSVMKELLARPMESELVKKPVKQVSRMASGRIVASAIPRTERVRQAGQTRDYPEDPRTAAPPPPTEPHSPAGTNGDSTRPDVLQSHPRRTYGSSPRRRPPHLKIAIITGLLAFVIAALVLTVPELVLGGAVSSHHSTTLFGGGSSKSKSSDKTSTDQSTTPSGKQPQGQTTPATPPPTTGGSTPTTTTPAPSTTPQAAPAPQQTAPPPPSGGTPTPVP